MPRGDSTRGRGTFAEATRGTRRKATIAEQYGWAARILPDLPSFRVVSAGMMLQLEMRTDADSVATIRKRVEHAIERDKRWRRAAERQRLECQGST